MLHYSFFRSLSYANFVTLDSNYQFLPYQCGVIDRGGTQEVKMSFSDLIKETRGPQQTFADSRFVGSMVINLQAPEL